jgi:hypothetical protein
MSLGLELGVLAGIRGFSARFGGILAQKMTIGSSVVPTAASAMRIFGVDNAGAEPIDGILTELPGTDEVDSPLWRARLQDYEVACALIMRSVGYGKVRGPGRCLALRCEETHDDAFMVDVMPGLLSKAVCEGAPSINLIQPSEEVGLEFSGTWVTAAGADTTVVDGLYVAVAGPNHAVGGCGRNVPALPKAVRDASPETNSVDTR